MVLLEVSTMYDVNGLQLEVSTYMFLILLNVMVTGKGHVLFALLLFMFRFVVAKTYRKKVVTSHGPKIQC